MHDRKDAVLHFTLRRIHLYLILLLMTLLTSCSHIRKDGPPNYYVDVSKIPNAVPKAEPLAKYGNMPSYRVFGKRYYTLRTSRNYDRVGIASWYGTKFHEQRTSSGEPYDMLAMTAAHKTLPLPTYVEVTNLSNHRKVIVKVNDRGPFESNRLIDLSYVAAKKLGMTGRGTAYVRVRAIDPQTCKPVFNWFNKAPVRKANDPWVNDYTGYQPVYLQVGVYRNRTSALRMQKKLSSILSTPVRISKRRYYRIQIGPLRDRLTVNRVAHQLKKIGMKANKITGA